MTSPPLDVLRRSREEAAAWRLVLTDAGLETRADFEAWLAAGPANREAWMRVQRAWAAMDVAPEDPRLLEIRQAALTRKPRSRRRSLWGALAAASLALAVPAGLSALGLMTSEKVLSTPRLERRVVRLEDGSRVTLDGDTQIRVRLHGQGRDIELVRGQARFDVFHDADRPFRVHAGDQTITALGTAFTVDRSARSLVVTLLEGQVAVGVGAPGLTDGSSPTLLRPGQRLMASLAPTPAKPRVEAVTLGEATAWETGQLVFDDEPLGQVVERVSRYSPSPITVGDAATARLRVSGVFKAGDGDTFVEAVTTYFPLRADRAPTGAIVLNSSAEKSR